MAAPVDSWLISFLRLICHTSAVKLVLGVMSHTMPSDVLVDFSGSSSGFGDVMMATLPAEQPRPLGAPPVAAQRTGSAAVEKAARPPLPFSAALGARKPLAIVPR